MNPPAQNPGLAALLTVLASAFVAGTMLLAKAIGTGTLGEPLHPLQISHGRFLFAFLAIGLTVLIKRPPLRRTHLKLHAARSGFGWGGVTLMFAAASFIPLADATAISFLNPVFAMVLAIIFLHERAGPWRWAAVVLALIGAIILLRPGAGAVQPGALLALAAALSIGIELILIKQLSGREGPLSILFINNAIGLTIANMAVLFVWQMPTASQWMALVTIGLLMAAAQTCFVNAVARADASFVSPFFYATLVFSALYDALVFGQWPDTTSLVGAGIILAGAALLAWRETRLRVSCESPSAARTSTKR